MYKLENLFKRDSFVQAGKTFEYISFLKDNKRYYEFYCLDTGSNLGYSFTSYIDVVTSVTVSSNHSGYAYVTSVIPSGCSGISSTNQTLNMVVTGYKNL